MRVKVSPEHDILISPRNVDLKLQESTIHNTKSGIALKNLLDAPENSADQQSAKTKPLSIICADDYYYNLEALRLVFSNLGLLDYCQFVSEGRQAINSCVSNLNEAGSD